MPYSWCAIHSLQRIDVKFHFIRDLQDDHVVNVVYVNTESQLADLFTKGLEGPRIQKLRNDIGVSCFWVGVGVLDYKPRMRKANLVV